MYVRTEFICCEHDAIEFAFIVFLFVFPLFWKCLLTIYMNIYNIQTRRLLSEEFVLSVQEEKEVFFCIVALLVEK